MGGQGTIPWSARTRTQERAMPRFSVAGLLMLLVLLLCASLVIYPVVFIVAVKVVEYMLKVT